MKIAIHMLTPYPPSNPNRDELGTPKTAVVGGELRQRISSQSLKRAWRLSDTMVALEATVSIRTREIGIQIRDRMIEAGVNEKSATKAGTAILAMFGTENSKRPLTTSEVVIFGAEEWTAAEQLADACARESRQPTDDELAALPRDTISVDVAMFGRMRAAEPKWNVDAAVAVAHALTTNKIAIESDFWTAVDDLNVRDDVSGAGGMGDREFASGIYYLYANIDCDALVQNLGGDAELAGQGATSLVRAMATPHLVLHESATNLQPSWPVLGSPAAF